MRAPTLGSCLPEHHIVVRCPRCSSRSCCLPGRRSLQAESAPWLHARCRHPPTPSYRRPRPMCRTRRSPTGRRRIPRSPVCRSSPPHPRPPRSSTQRSSRRRRSRQAHVDQLQRRSLRRRPSTAARITSGFHRSASTDQWAGTRAETREHPVSVSIVGAARGATTRTCWHTPMRRSSRYTTRTFRADCGRA